MGSVIIPDHSDDPGVLPSIKAVSGSVILKYPGFKDRCENYITRMIAEGSATGGIYPKEKVVLESTYEAAVFGAAVAVALAEDT